jgi:hypothetical protein
VSPSSPATGGETADLNAPKTSGDKVEIELEASRHRTIGWAIGGTVLGVLLVLKLGTVGVWAGWVLIAVGIKSAVQLVQTYRYPAGSIVVAREEVLLPRGLYRAQPLRVATKDVTAVYFLRRSVPWNRSSPLLVVEVGPRALLYPRDWFASEADQRYVVTALLDRCALRPPAQSRA